MLFWTLVFATPKPEAFKPEVIRVWQDYRGIANGIFNLVIVIKGQ